MSSFQYYFLNCESDFIAEGNRLLGLQTYNSSIEKRLIAWRDHFPRYVEDDNFLSLERQLFALYASHCTHVSPDDFKWAAKVFRGLEKAIDADQSTLDLVVTKQWFNIEYQVTQLYSDLLLFFQRLSPSGASKPNLLIRSFFEYAPIHFDIVFSSIFAGLDKIEESLFQLWPRLKYRCDHSVSMNMSFCLAAFINSHQWKPVFCRGLAQKILSNDELHIRLEDDFPGTTSLLKELSILDPFAVGFSVLRFGDEKTPEALVDTFFPLPDELLSHPVILKYLLDPYFLESKTALARKKLILELIRKFHPKLDTQLELISQACTYGSSEEEIARLCNKSSHKMPESYDLTGLLD